MRFRQATEADIPAIAATFTGRNAVPLEPRVREALPGLLRQVIASPACTLTVFELSDAAGMRVFSFAAGLFVRDELIQRYLTDPQPALVGSVLAAILDDGRPLLTLDEVRQGNAAGGLNLVVFSMPLGNRAWDDPLVAELRQLAPQAFVRFYGGYRLKAIYYEVFTDEVAAYLQAGGYRLLHDFSSLAGTGMLGPEARPRMLRLTAAELPPGAMSMASQMFSPPQPRLGLTPAEQRIALQALDGASDRALAESLGLSAETVRSNWRSIYRRLVWELPEIETPAARGEQATRGQEKRRIAVGYLRQNMHELRPLPMTSRASSGPHGRRR
jgi:DNA-binding NarL/FixJ family response regulator